MPTYKQHSLEALRSAIESKTLRLVIYKGNPPPWLRALRDMDQDEVADILSFANPKALKVWKMISVWWDTQRRPPSYAELAHSCGMSINLCVLYVNLLHSVGLVKRAKGSKSHRDIYPYYQSSRTTAAHLLRQWSAEFPDHPLAKESKAFYARYCRMERKKRAKDALPKTTR